MSAEFSAEPWIVDEFGPDDAGRVVIVAPHENDAVPVAECAMDAAHRPLSRTRANAALIAAAPQMFHALEAVRDGADDAMQRVMMALWRAGGCG